MSGADELLLTFYGDDFTGSTDALECLTRAGAPTALFIETPTRERLARHPGLRAAGVAGMTRSMAPAAAEKELRPALRKLRELGARHVHYKVCSTFDSSPEVGSIGRVIDVAAEVFGARFVPLLVGAPALGRHCVFGNLFARCGSDGEIHRLDRHPSMRRHPITPADEGDLRIHLARQTRKRIGLFDVLQIELPPAQAKAALARTLQAGWEVVLFDVLYLPQLGRIGALLDGQATRERPLFSVGSSRVEMALGAHWAAEGLLTTVERWPDPGPAQPLLVASGSCSPVTKRQVRWAVGKGFSEVALDAAVLAGGAAMEKVVARTASEVAGHLQAGRSTVVHTGRGGTDRRLAASAWLPATALGGVVRRVVESGAVKRLCVAGGDTSSFVARALGIEVVEMIGPLAPGAPLCRAAGAGLPPRGLEVVFKGGQVGAVDFFADVARGKLS